VSADGSDVTPAACAEMFVIPTVLQVATPVNASTLATDGKLEAHANTGCGLIRLPFVSCATAVNDTVPFT
jgi:hypothetical protein